MLLSRFVQDRAAGVVPLLALAIVPMMGVIGAAVDYSHASAVRTAMQTALDSTALMLSREAQDLQGAALNAKASEYFNALFQQPDAHNLQISATVSPPVAGNFTLQVSGSAAVETTFSRVLGRSEIGISALSEAVWGMKRLEIALALDNTGSMANGGKIVELKKAVHKLLDTLEKAARTPDDVKVAIVPFDVTVRVDQSHKDPAWWVKFDPDFHKPTWIGCLADRDQPNDVKDVAPVPGAGATHYPAEKCAHNGAVVKMRPLTNDWHALRLTTNGMNPNGMTNVTVGLVWAWHALTPALPLTEASAPQPDLDKVIILLTDGENTQNRWTWSTSAIDARTAAACANIKAENIKIYTVRVADGNKNLLKSCATKPEMYYEIEDAVELNTVFSSIAKNLANLRLSK